MSEHNLRAIKTQLSGSNGFTGEEGPGTRSGRRSARGRSQPFFIGVAGGTASGKTTVCDQIMQRLHDQCVVMLSQDSFYRGLTPEECKNVKAYSFDEPDAFDTKALVQCLQALRAMQAVQVPVYDFTLHQRAQETRRVEPADVVIIEGILVLHMESVRKLLNMKIFVDTDDDVRLARRIQRDVAIRGRDVASVIEQYTQQVKPAFDQYVAPSRKHADVIIPWAREENVVAIDLITQHIRMKLQQPDLRRIYHNLEVIPSNFQIRGMHTILRDQNTNKTDFIFIADRLLRLVVEAGLGFLPFTELTVMTPTGSPYVGVDFAKRLCGVSIIRSGESMENALRACCKGIKIGKILVHRVRDQLVEQELIYEKLPKDIAERHVLLMDPILATGNSAARAIQVLLDKGVEEGKILFLSLIAAPEGVHKICGQYPRVKVITTEIDEGIASDFQVIPGVGEFGDRYFCD
ncbi:Uridine kinase-like protein 1, chloroplastic [Trebouxia sp. C0010 RCD-2024]